MLFLAGLGQFVVAFFGLLLDLLRMAWEGLKLLARPPRLVMNGRNIGRLPRGVVVCVLGSAWWGMVKSLCGFCLDVLSAAGAFFIRSGPTCPRCGGYIELDGCPCGFRAAAHRAAVVEGIAACPTSAQRERLERAAFAREGAKVNPHVPADYAARLQAEPPDGLVGPITRLVFVNNGGELGRARVHEDGSVCLGHAFADRSEGFAGTLPDRPCDMIVNDVGPFPEPWERICDRCGKPFGVCYDGSALACLCVGQVIEWAPRATTIPADFDGSVTVDNPAGFVSVGT